MERSNVSKQRFLIVTLLNVLITVVEIIGGLVSGSLALLSDAFHNLGDSISIVLGYFAQVISGRKIGDVLMATGELRFFQQWPTVSF